MNGIRINEEKYVFVSYHSQYYMEAFAIKELLKHKQIPCWIVPYDIADGYLYEWIINENVDNCTCFLLLEGNIEDKHANREKERAVSCGKHIINVQLSDFVFEPYFKFDIKTSYVAPAKRIEENYLPKAQELVETLSSITGIEYSEPKDAQQILAEMGAELEEKFATFIKEDEENPPTIIDKVKNFFGSIFSLFEKCEYEENDE